MNQDTQKSQGRVRLESYRLSKFNRFIVKVIKFFNFNPATFVRSFGQLQFDTGFISNMVMNAGKAAEAGRMSGVGGVAAFNYLAVGSSNTAVAATQTALGSEWATLGLSRQLVTPTLITTSVTNDTFQLQATWTASGSASIQEMGIFNAASVGTMLGRALVNNSVQNNDTLIGTYTFQYL